MFLIQQSFIHLQDGNQGLRTFTCDVMFNARLIIFGFGWICQEP